MAGGAGCARSIAAGWRAGRTSNRGPAPLRRSMLAKGGPEKAAELARHRRHGLVVSLPVRHQSPVSSVQPRLRPIREGDHPARLSLAALTELLPDGGLVPIVPRRLDEQPPRLLVARLRDRPASLTISGGVLARHQA